MQEITQTVSQSCIRVDMGNLGEDSSKRSNWDLKSVPGHTPLPMTPINLAERIKVEPEVDLTTAQYCQNLWSDSLMPRA